MHSFSLFVLVAVLAININGQFPTAAPPSIRTCSKYKCAKVLEECGTFNISLTDTVATVVGCRGEAECSDSVRGICVAKIALGQPTESGADCESGTEDRAGFCALKIPKNKFLYPGESCDHDIQCIYSSFAPGDDTINLCNSGKCKKVNNGEYCSHSKTSSGIDAQCHYNKAYCSSSSRCEKNIKKGGLCNQNDDSVNGCGLRSNCVPSSSNGDAGTCQPKYSLGEGKYCDIGKTDQCKEQLYCLKPTVSTETFGKCTKPIDTFTLNKPCVQILGTTGPFGGRDSCNTTNRETCSCTDKSTTEVCRLSLAPKGYNNAQWNYQECIRKNCGYKGGSPLDDNKCIYDHCRNQACKLYEVSKKNSGGEDCQFYSFCNSGFLLSFSPFLILSAFVAVFLF